MNSFGRRAPMAWVLAVAVAFTVVARGAMAGATSVQVTTDNADAVVRIETGPVVAYSFGGWVKKGVGLVKDGAKAVAGWLGGGGGASGGDGGTCNAEVNVEINGCGSCDIQVETSCGGGDGKSGG